MQNGFLPTPTPPPPKTFTLIAIYYRNALDLRQSDAERSFSSNNSLPGATIISSAFNSALWLFA